MVEFDGLQHFEPVSIYGGEEGFERTYKADNIKNKYCYDHGISILRIPHDQLNKVDELVRRFYDSAENELTKENEKEYYAKRKSIA